MLPLYLEPVVLGFLLTQVYTLALISKPFGNLVSSSSFIRFIIHQPALPKHLTPSNLQFLDHPPVLAFSSLPSTTYTIVIPTAHLFQEAFPTLSPGSLLPYYKCKFYSSFNTQFKCHLFHLSSLTLSSCIFSSLFLLLVNYTPTVLITY